MHDKIDLAPFGRMGEDRPLYMKPIDYCWQHRRWILIVLVPTMLVALYFEAIATPQYESEAHIVVRNAQGGASPPTGLSQALSLVGSPSASASDAASVSDYLSSHDAVAALQKSLNLVEIFQRPEADFLSRLRPSSPTPERLLSYYRDQATVRMDAETGITAIRVRTFRPDDSYRIVDKLMELGEARVNTLNQRAYESSLKQASKQLSAAEQGVADAQRALTQFRQARRNIDPIATGQAQIGVVSGLQTTLAQARAQRDALAASVAPGSPQIRAMDARVRALEAQVGAQAGVLTGSNTAIAANVGDYQGLQLRQQFASRRYDEAAAAFQRARDQAQRQQLFIVRIVEPNHPVKSQYPKSAKVIFTVFIALALAYSLGWLIAAGVREHAA